MPPRHPYEDMRQRIYMILTNVNQDIDVKLEVGMKRVEGRKRMVNLWVFRFINTSNDQTVVFEGFEPGHSQKDIDFLVRAILRRQGWKKRKGSSV